MCPSPCVGSYHTYTDGHTRVPTHRKRYACMSTACFRGYRGNVAWARRSSASWPASKRKNYPRVSAPRHWTNTTSCSARICRSSLPGGSQMRRPSSEFHLPNQHVPDISVINQRLPALTSLHISSVPQAFYHRIVPYSKDCTSPPQSSPLLYQNCTCFSCRHNVYMV